MVEEKPPAPNPGGGGGKKKRQRKRGGGGGGAGSAGGTQTSGNGSAKDVQNSGGSGGPSATPRTANKSGSRSRRRGGGGGRSGGGGGAEASRFKANSPSPLQLPHVKVTLRNIANTNKHGSIEDIVDSVRSFLEGAFPSSATSAGDGTVESDAYMLAWQLEKEEFESAKAMFADQAANTTTASTTSSSGGPSSNTARVFSSGWVYEEKPSSLPSNRESLLPQSNDIVTQLMSNETEKKLSPTSNINWVVDTAMSQMMQECGKQYLHYVGGRIVLDEESLVEVVLAEKIEAEKKRMDELKKTQDAEAAVSGDEPADQTGTNNAPEDKKEDDKSVEDVTKGIEKLSTTDNKQQWSQLPAIRVRILSVTPIKNSKRRGEIGGKVQLAMYPPDPCVLFKETCRDAGKMAGDLQFEKMNAAKKEEEAKAVAASETPVAVEGVPEEGKDKEEEKDGVSSETKVDGANAEATDEPKVKENIAKPSPAVNRAPQPPQIPYYPLLSPTERSRAVARSRVLMNRTIEAMKLHAAQSKDATHSQWEILEAPSQKTWKGKPHSMVGSLMAGKPLSDLVAEQESAKASGATKKGRGKGFGGFDSRADRLDSTIENSEDYKAFMVALKAGGAAPSDKDTGSKDAKKSEDKPAADKPAAVDEEGRPLSAIVMHLREKQAEVDKVKAEARAAADKARKVVTDAKEKARKEKQKQKKEAAKKRKKEAARAKKQSSRSGASSSSSSRPSSKSTSSSMPPPGAMLLKKGGASTSIPRSGFGGP